MYTIHIEKLNAWLKIAEFEVIENAKSSSEHSFNKGDTQSFSHLFVNSSFILLLHGFLFIYWVDDISTKFIELYSTAKDQTMLNGKIELKNFRMRQNEMCHTKQ